MPQKALRNTSGKPTTVEDLDRRDAARQEPYATKPVKVSVVATDSLAASKKAGDKLERESNRLRQAKLEQHKVADNAQDVKEFHVRRDG